MIGVLVNGVLESSVLLVMVFIKRTNSVILSASEGSYYTKISVY